MINSTNKEFVSDIQTFLDRKIDMKHCCDNCGHTYDPEEGDPTQDIPEGTDFDDLPDDWMCPECGEGKEMFFQC